MLRPVRFLALALAVLATVPLTTGRATADETWCLCSAQWGGMRKECLAPDCSTAVSHWRHSIVTHPFAVARYKDCGFNTDSSPAAKQFYRYLKKKGRKVENLLCSSNDSEFSADSAFERAISSDGWTQTQIAEGFSYR